MKAFKTSIIFLLSVSAVVFCTLGSYTEISDYDIVSGIAIDYDGDKWTVTNEICTPSSDNDFGSKSTYVTGSGYTLDNAFDEAGLKSTNTLYTDSCQLYLVSRNAKDNNCLREYFKSDGINMRAVAVWTDGSAADIFASGDDEENRTKSLALSKKIIRYCDEEGAPVPRVQALLQGRDTPLVNTEQTIERSVSE